MINVSQYNNIKELARMGVPFLRITKEVNADVKTVRKYAQCQDFSPKFPRKVTRRSKIEPYNTFILNILENDRFVWYKQRHTAKRILRLLQEQGFDGSYSTVQRHVRQLRKQLTQKWNANKSFEEQTWQADCYSVLLPICMSDTAS